MPNEIFVFGSNLAGRHGKGAALFARQHHGAIYGQGEGLQGTSYAIPTKGFAARGEPMPVLPIARIRVHVLRFILFARRNPEMTFRLTTIGCGLAGYTPEQIAPLFANAPSNVLQPVEFTGATSCAHASPSP